MRPKIESQDSGPLGLILPFYSVLITAGVKLLKLWSVMRGAICAVHLTHDTRRTTHDFIGPVWEKKY